MRSKMSECFASASKSLHASFNRGPFEVVFWSVCVGTVYEILSSLISDLFSCYGGKKKDRHVGNQLNIFAFDLFLCLKLWQVQTLLQL